MFCCWLKQSCLLSAELNVSAQVSIPYQGNPPRITEQKSQGAPSKNSWPTWKILSAEDRTWSSMTKNLVRNGGRDVTITFFSVSVTGQQSRRCENWRFFHQLKKIQTHITHVPLQNVNISCSCTVELEFSYFVFLNQGFLSLWNNIGKRK